ncbi:hypothetical protein CAOG_00058 [Capsaspora owczarzaki ATCC 30864]|uniref:CN hydrolase domain-containing protein n=1 Tax=Capsaspora owczarzaki (strain ATCC 30864) TaxID=595528 RepID=A0A0D2VF99_CAPO3|nr:hypothetical protein CAOG_00058 [Capsaspora owczarzaki ATCC 30864]KJE88397.1 hypothetical protein CAOG_000058 [Capsaspora owczarzaki ATCC 30864]|eukprot:XP_004364929.1 hypothetical protein CAOG_00058 [Capsaspora owczarzaki ATCC 30864]
MAASRATLLVCNGALAALAMLLLIAPSSLTVVAATAGVPYRAAMVEHSPVFPANATPVEMMAANMALYELHMVAAKASGAQVVVFPEFGLGPKNFIDRDQLLPFAEHLPAVSNATGQTAPCYDASAPPVFRNASCFALNYGILVSINMYDVQPCTTASDPRCPRDGRFQYNTEVVFDERGIMVAKYYKTHVFYLNCFDEPATPDLVYFTSAFNVTFGVFTCFDIMFETPSVPLVNLGIRNFLYSVAMSALGPVGKDIFEIWSARHNSTLLASNDGTGPSGAFVHGVNKVSQQVNIPGTTNEVLLLADLVA